MKAIIPRGIATLRRHKANTVLLLGVDLSDAREEMFVRMVCDGLSLGVAFARAGFTSKMKDAAYLLFALPRIQTRAAAILEARRTQGVVTLPEVTDMLKRVFAGAHSEGEYSAAHNAAFSLARLYGHVTDKATFEVIRRPSRDPDAPSEQVLSDWVASLPVVSGPVSPSLESPSQGPPSHAPAGLLGSGLEPWPGVPGSDAPGVPGSDAPGVPSPSPEGPSPEGPSPDLLNAINDLHEAETKPSPAAESRAGTGNGAPSSPVTGAPTERAHSELLEPPGPKQKRVPPKQKRVPVKKRVKKRKLKPRIPSAKQLFG